MIRLALALSLLATPVQAKPYVPLSAPNHTINWDTRTVTIQNTVGGYVDRFAIQFWAWEVGRFKIVIEGECSSACTMVLKNPNACAMPNAVFGFHTARHFNKKSGVATSISKDANQAMWEHYPDNVKAKVGTLTDNMVYIKGTDLLPPCGFSGPAVPYVPSSAIPRL